MNTRLVDSDGFSRHSVMYDTLHEYICFYLSFARRCLVVGNISNSLSRFKYYAAKSIQPMRKLSSCIEL